MDERHSVDELVTLLGELVNDAWSMPLSGGKVVLERDRLLDLVEEIKAVLPGDLQQARAIVASRNELAAAARRDADAIIRAAEEKAKELVSESAILREARREAKELQQASIAKAKETVAAAEAKARQTITQAETHANELVKQAEAKAKELRNATTGFVDEALSRSDEALSQSLAELRRVKQQFKQQMPMR
jgi:cell division septum initiation protein DivIVA